MVAFVLHFIGVCVLTFHIFSLGEFAQNPQTLLMFTFSPKAGVELNMLFKLLITRWRPNTEKCKTVHCKNPGKSMIVFILCYK